MKKGLLTRAECEAMRGIAILGIVLHNYAHWLGFAVKENEYTFTQSKADHMMELLLQPSGDLPLHLLSFFGHYGVPIFLFLSAYGLVMKYENQPASHVPAGNNHAGIAPFMRFHFLKLFKMMIVGFVVFTLVDAITPGRHQYQAIDIIAQLGMFNNLLPRPNDIIWPGPYWFFGLMLQLYAVYRLVLYRRHWGVTVALMIGCTLLQMTCEPTGDALNRWRYNCIGGILPFGCGLLFARYARRPLPNAIRWGLLAMATVLLFVLSMNYWTWYIVPVVVCVLAIVAVKVMPSWLVRPLVTVGNISAALFIIHPTVRKIFIPISRGGDVYSGFLLYIVAALALAWCVKLLLDRIPDPKMK